MSNMMEQIWKREDVYGGIELKALLSIHGNKGGDDSLKILSVEWGQVIELRPLRNLLVALKRKVD